MAKSMKIFPNVIDMNGPGDTHVIEYESEDTHRLIQVRRLEDNAIVAAHVVLYSPPHTVIQSLGFIFNLPGGDNMKGDTEDWCNRCDNLFNLNFDEFWRKLDDE